MNNYILVHGSFGNPFVNFIPYLRGEIEKRNLEVYTPDFPTGVGYQNYTNWSRLLKCYLDAGILNENTTIFAHSIAPVFICKFLIKNKVKVKRLVFISGFNNYFVNGEEIMNTVNKTMYLDNLEDIKNYCSDIICFYTKNDPYVKYEVEKDFADLISTKQVVIEDGGRLFLVSRVDRLFEVRDALIENKLAIKEIQFIYHDLDSTSKLVLIEANTYTYW